VIFNHNPEMRGRQIIFTLRVKDSKGKGASRSLGDRRTISACWHVHGHFFEELFELKPEATVVSNGKTKITKDNVWENDQKVGGTYIYQWKSTLCECN
jgi:hypothetical protein